MDTHMPDPFSNDQRRLAVLGGSSGIGAAVANLVGAGMGVETYATGIQDFRTDDYARLRDFIFQFRPTHAVYSIGINQPNWAHHVIRAQFRDSMDTNVWGFMEVVQVMLDLHEQTSLPYKPSMVAISSEAGRRPMRAGAVYCAASAALDMLIRVLARELGGSGWRINGVAPGKVSGTPLSQYVDGRIQEIRGWTPEYLEAHDRMHSALGRPVTPEEVAHVVADVLFGPAALNGSIVEVNGGR